VVVVAGAHEAQQGVVICRGEGSFAELGAEVALAARRRRCSDLTGC
jgi:hypothetical protein